MAESNEVLQDNLEELTDVIRRLAQLVPSIQDPTRFLRATAALGSLAGAATGFSEIAETSFEELMSDRVESSPTLPQLESTLPESSVTASAAAPDETPEQTVDRPSGAEQAKREPSTKFTDREKLLLDFLETQTNEKFSPRTLKGLMGASSPASASALFKRFIDKLHADPAYSNRLVFSGETSQRLYWLEPEQIEEVVLPSVTQGPASEESVPLADHVLPEHNAKGALEPGLLALPPEVTIERHQSEEVATPLANSGEKILTNWDLRAVIGDGYKKIMLGGKRLFLTSMAVEAIFTVSEYPNGITFNELRTALHEKTGAIVSPDSLNTALTSIAAHLEDYVGGWIDERVPIDGEPDEFDRRIGLRNIETESEEENPDFLAVR